MSVLWGLGQQQGPTPGEQFNTAFQQGTQRRQQEELQQALRGYAANPNDPNALNPVIQADPVMGMQLRQQGVERQQQAQTRMNEQIRLGARILRQINPQDQAGWARARQLAQQVGVDVSQVPEAFDPAYRDALLERGRALEPQQDPFTLEPGEVRYGPDGREIARGGPERPRYYSVPQGGRLELDPSYQGPVQGGGASQPPQPSPAQQYTPEQLDGMAREAIRNGANPEQVRQRMLQLRQGGPASQAPATFP